MQYLPQYLPQQLHGSLRGVAKGYDDVRVWLHGVSAVRATKKSAGDDTIASKGCPRVEFLLQGRAAMRATELPVESIPCFHRWCKLIGVPLDTPEYIGGTHFSKGAHTVRLPSHTGLEL